MTGFLPQALGTAVVVLVLAVVVSWLAAGARRRGDTQPAMGRRQRNGPGLLVLGLLGILSNLALG